MKTILLIGPCGSGKTWVMKELIRLLKLEQGAQYGMLRYKRNGTVIVAGNYDGSTFEGSDKLSMAVMRDVPEFLEEFKKYKYFVCEGDRFTNSTFIEAAKPFVIRILDDGSKGRKLRGSSQSERHLKSIETRVKNMSNVVDQEVATSVEALKVIRKLVA